MTAPTRADLESFTLPGSGPEIELAAVPAGSFLMGDVADRSPEEDTRPVHEVGLDSYRIGVYPVANAQFAHFVEQTGYCTTREVEDVSDDVWSDFTGKAPKRAVRSDSHEEFSAFTKFVHAAIQSIDIEAFNLIASETVKSIYPEDIKGLDSDIREAVSMEKKVPKMGGFIPYDR